MAESGEDLARLVAGGAAPRRRRFRWAVGLGLVLVAGGWFLWPAGQVEPADVVYTTESVGRGDLTVTVTATGTVQPTIEVDVSSELSGILAQVEVDFNDTVAAGQVLARLDTAKLADQMAISNAQLAAARARLLQASTTAREAEADLARAQALSDRGVTSRSDAAGFIAAYERANASVAIAEADVILAEANLSLVQTDLEKGVIRAPIDGIVLDRTAEVGQIVTSSQSGSALFRLAGDLRQMDLLVNVDEADIGRVQPGQGAVFTVDAYETQSFPARITQVRFAPETVNDVVSYKAVLAVENPGGQLRPGMTATATITVAEVTDALIVPNAALRYAPPRAGTSGGGAGLLGLILPMPGGRATAGTASGRSIWVLRGGVPTEIAVTPGQSDGASTALSSDDLAEGDLVIIDQKAGTR
ncbi:MAG: efflux RND transporter periplasmic adaptor subunit [Paracoccaceae bacterium]